MQRLKLFQRRSGNILLLSGILLTAPTLALASDEVDIDRATWRADLNRLTVRGENAPDNSTVIIRYGEKDDNGAVIGTTEADGDGDWEFRIVGIDPVPCDVTAVAEDGEDDDKEVRNAPNNCSNNGGVVQPPPDPVCNISVSPTTLAFGDVTVGNSATLSTTVSNNGDATCNVNLARTGSGDFAITSNTSFNVAPGGSQNVSVSYTPGQVGGDTGEIAVNSNDPDTATVNVNLTGNGVQQQVNECNISVNPTTLAFGNVTVGNSAAQTTTVSNSGDAACSVNLARSGSNAFAITSNTSFSVAPGGSQTVSVSYTPGQVGADSGTLAVNSNDPDTGTVNVDLSGNGVQQQAQCNPADLNMSINSTSQNGCPDQVLAEVPQVPNNSYSILAINDLGMHCGDLDTRIASILPPFQAMLAQVIQKGSTPTLNPANVDLHYSAVRNPNDPILGSNVFDGVNADGTTYKTNFWDTVAAGTYDPFYPAFNPFNPAQAITPLVIDPDVGLPVPNVEHFYLGADGVPDTGDESLSVVLHAMPGIAGPYSANDPQLAEEHYIDKPFFMNFPFGYVAEGVNWYEGAGIPFAAFDDNGRENAYPLVRVEAKNAAGTTLSTVDTVLPISGEANCTNCHAQPDDLTAITGKASRSSAPTDALAAAGLPVALSLDDPDNNLPPRVSLEYAGDINTLRLHDLKHGANYVTPSAADDGTTVAAPCTIDATNPNGDTNCLTNKALVQTQPVVCQVCHYTPALDLAQLGPLTGPEGSIANGRNQGSHRSNSNVMHSHHGSLGVFTEIPPPIQAANGAITNQAERLTALEESCYQCHPGTNVQCLRGAMFNGGMLCNDCHGDMAQVGNDFSRNVSPTTPGAFELGGNFYDPADPQPRVPWANEPGCGSCHTGDFNTSIAGDNGTVVNTADVNGNTDGIRLRVAYLTDPVVNPKAAPIVPTDKRFAEPAVPATTANGVANNGAGNPQLYRVSTGHGGVMCEGCHGATHAEWPNANPNSNDNVTANQLQGHTGTIIECSTCHGTTNLGNTLNGPHGMHPVGNDQTVNNGSDAGPRISFVDGGHSNINTNGCDDCHGGGGRGNNQGTVLSVAKKDRRLNGQTVPAGTPVGCAICH